MPRNGSGSYSLPSNSWNPPVNGASATPADFAALSDDIAQALTASVAADGQTPMTGNLAMGNNRVTGMAEATSLTDAPTAGQVQSGSLTYLTGVAGTNTITASATGLSAYAVGNEFRFIAAGANTGAVTLNINSIGAISVTKNGSLALSSGDIASGDVVSVVYDGARFQMLSKQFPGSIVGRAFGSYATNTDLTTQIPGDDTVPQNTEGTEIISLSFTPKSVSNRLRVRFQGEFGLSSGGSGAAAIFASSAGASAIAATATTVSSSGLFAPLAAESEFVPGTTSAVTISVRVGPTSAVTMRMNGNTSGRLFGGVSKATLVVEEIAA